MTLLIQESFVNVTKGHRSGESGVYEPLTQNLGELYRALVREHGRCTGCVYVDTEDGTRAIGWVFLKRKQYADCPETFLAETWVTLHEQAPETHVTHHYLRLK